MSKFRVQITPLLRPNTTLTNADIKEATQFGDVEVDHALNGNKTAKVNLSMHESIVDGLQPWEFALRILYEERAEPVFWGPANIKDDYGNGVCIIEGQDPSFRLAHHYVRRGDTAINDIPETDKGKINADFTGIQSVVDAAQNLAGQNSRNDPSLGLTPSNDSFVDRVAPLIIERGQECWAIIQEISKTNGGPDFDMETNPGITGQYAYLVTYANLGTDRTSTTPDAPTAGQVVLNYGPQLTSVEISPSRATTHAHVLSSDAKFRRTGGSSTGSNKIGPTVDWIPTDLQFQDGDDAVLQELADAHVAAYGMPPKFITITTRPDSIITHNYGAPSFATPAGMKAPTFYIGDRVTVRATRGYRTFSGPARITRVRLSQPGTRGPVQTSLTLVPTVGDLGAGEES